MGDSLTIEQFQLASASIAATTGIMGLAAVYFVMARRSVGPAQQTAVWLAAAVCGVATFHYLRAIDEWTNAYVFDGSVYQVSDHPFVNSSRYADWVTTLPLLAIQIVFLVKLDRRSSTRLAVKLSIASLTMLALGYPGEVSSDTDTKLVFLGLGAIPLIYVVYLLWVEMTRSLDRQNFSVDVHVSNARLVLLASWILYPIGYLFPVFGLDTGWGEAARQAFYSVADLISKPLFGLFVLRAALAATRTDDDAPFIEGSPDGPPRYAVVPLPPLPTIDDGEPT